MVTITQKTHLGTFVESAANMAMDQFIAQLKGRRITDSEADVALNLIKDGLRDALGQAITEMMEACDCRMEQIGLASFQASMRLVGLKAFRRFQELESKP